jgi:hypothetical protein
MTLLEIMERKIKLNLKMLAEERARMIWKGWAANVHPTLIAQKVERAEKKGVVRGILNAAQRMAVHVTRMRIVQKVGCVTHAGIAH